MRCAELRDALLAAPVATLARLADPASRPTATEAGLAAHLAACAECAAFARRAAALRGALAARHAGVTPGPEFAAKVVANLPDTAEMLGWASLRLLPAAVALAVAFSWFGLSRGPGLSALLLHADDPLVLSYVALGAEEAE